MKYPKLPTTVSAPGGEIAVRITPAPLKIGTQEVWGAWDEGQRTIEISTDVPVKQRWKVFFHELTHVAITDSGLDNMISDELHEAICDAVATQRVRERFG